MDNVGSELTKCFRMFKFLIDSNSHLIKSSEYLVLIILQN